MRSPIHSTNASDTDGGRVLENPDFYAYNYIPPVSIDTNDNNLNDWVSVGDYGSGTNNYLRFGAGNNSSILQGIIFVF